MQEAYPYLESFVIASILTTLACPGIVVAQGGETLGIEPDARYLAMGSAGTGLADDVNAVFWNPAGLAFQRSLESSFAAMTLDKRIRIRRMAFRYASSTGNAIGLAMWATRWSTLPCILGWSSSACRNDPRDLTVSLSLAHRFDNRFSIGSTVKAWRIKRWDDWTYGAQSRSESTVVLDVAALYRIDLGEILDHRSRASIGMIAANLGGKLDYRFPEAETVMPRLLRIGASLAVTLDSARSAQLVSDLTIPLEGRRSNSEPDEDHFSQVTAGMGLEYPLDEYLTVRGGLALGRYQLRDGVYPTFGGGISFGTLRLDVSWITGLDYVHVVTEDVRLTIRIGREDTTMPAFPRGRIPWKID